MNIKLFYPKDHMYVQYIIMNNTSQSSAVDYHWATEVIIVKINIMNTCYICS